jgi:hypothetical protein
MKSPRFSFRSVAPNLLLLCCFSAVVAPSSLTPRLFAQSASQRVVQGKVTDKSDKPIKGAVVYLKDSHTLAVKSFYTDDAGVYRFGQLSQNGDFEIWAESNGKKSATKTISSFDSKAEFNFALKIDTGS